MHILVINCGSSSLKADIINTSDKNTFGKLKAERLPDAPLIQYNKETVNYSGAHDLEDILTFCIQLLKEKITEFQIEAIGHRVVHGGDLYTQPVLIDEAVEKTVSDLISIAPLHNPANLMGIQICKKVFPNLPQVAVFDTAFHQTIPNRARHYAIDLALAEKLQLKRYGFHGTSHKYVSRRAASFYNTDIKQLRMISCHLGNGASICAVEFGRSAETSMGMTPLEGLVMGTRSGDLDPGIILSLIKDHGYSVEEVDELLNKKSGLTGLSTIGNDMRDILEKAAQGDENCRMALQVFSHRLTKYIGAYAAVMGGVDILIFTAGIGENAADIRKRVCSRLGFMGIVLDDDKNRYEKLSGSKDVIELHDHSSRVKIVAIATDEELSIALDTEKIVGEQNKVNTIPTIPIAVSARHVHLSQSTFEQLYGVGKELTVHKPLSQPGQFAAQETITILGPRNKIEQVRILGPFRNYDQVEISRTDEFFLGIDAPIRESGNIKGSPGILLEGPAGQFQIKEGVIQAWRHIHMHPNDAQVFGVKDKDIVSVDVNVHDRPITFKNVLIRVSDQFKLEMHIDTDEGNAADIHPGQEGLIELSDSSGVLHDKKL